MENIVIPSNNKYLLFFFSQRIKLIWNKVCDHKYVYLIILLTWTLPIVINVPKRFEPGITFSPGNGSGTGNLCYAIENGKRVIFTERQWYFSLCINITIFCAIIISYLITWCGIKKENEQKMDIISEEINRRSIRLFGYKVHARAVKKDLHLTTSLICICFIVFRLPLIVLGRSKLEQTLFSFLFALYTLQFCFHFIIYAIIQKTYRRAYCDILNVMVPCFFKCQRTISHEDTAVGNDLRNKPRTMSRWR